MKPRVSIITPYRNATRHLAESIGSVLGQTIEDWELLLIDDRSSDNSTRIAQYFARQDSRIRLLGTAARDCSGAAGARNVGLAEACGEFVAFLDADDMFLAGSLATALSLAEIHPSAALVCGATRWWHAAGEDRDWIDRVRRIRPGLHEPPYLLEQLILLQRDQVPCTCAVLARREAVVAAGGFEESLSLYEDQSLWARLLARHPAFIGTHLTSLYRQHSQSASALAERAGHYHRLRAHPARTGFLDWLGRDLADVATPRTMSALRVAQAMVTGSSTHLFVADRPRYVSLLVGNRWRRVGSKFRALARRLRGKRSILPPFTP